MKRLFFLSMVFLSGSIFLTGCEKDRVSSTNDNLRVMKSNDFINPFYYQLVDEGSSTYFDLHDNTYKTMTILRIDTIGTASMFETIPGEPHSIRYTCEGSGNTCGNAVEISNKGQTCCGMWYKIDDNVICILDRCD